MSTQSVPHDLLYDSTDLVLGVLLAASDGLAHAVHLAEEFAPPHPDEMLDDLVSRLRTCLAHLADETADVRALKDRAGDAQSAPVLRLVPDARPGA